MFDCIWKLVFGVTRGWLQPFKNARQISFPTCPGFSVTASAFVFQKRTHRDMALGMIVYRSNATHQQLVLPCWQCFRQDQERLVLFDLRSERVLVCAVLVLVVPPASNPATIIASSTFRGKWGVDHAAKLDEHKILVFIRWKNWLLRQKKKGKVFKAGISFCLIPSMSFLCSLPNVGTALPGRHCTDQYQLWVGERSAAFFFDIELFCNSGSL